VVCTVTGRTRRHGVAEVAMGTPLRDVIEEIGGGLEPGRQIVAVLSGVASPLLPAGRLDAPVSYEGLTAAGAGLGAAAFMVFDDHTDLVAVVQGVSRFLAIESCGQCTPCKRDGLAIAMLLDLLRESDPPARVDVEIADHVRTVADNARCSLATQHQVVVDSLLREFPEAVAAHHDDAPPGEPELIAPIVDIIDGRAVLDESHIGKQPDWSYDETSSGEWPAERFHPSRAGAAG
jgi:NADH:ubiquinone oxidoreductase subunit F (NADH-binding)